MRSRAGSPAPARLAAARCEGGKSLLLGTSGMGGMSPARVAPERRVIDIAHDTDDLSAGMHSAVFRRGRSAVPKAVRQVLPDRVLPWEVAVCQGLVDHYDRDGVAAVLVRRKGAPAHERHPHGVKEIGRDRVELGPGLGARCGWRVTIDRE